MNNLNKIDDVLRAVDTDFLMKLENTESLMLQLIGLLNDYQASLEFQQKIAFYGALNQFIGYALNHAMIENN